MDVRTGCRRGQAERVGSSAAYDAAFASASGWSVEFSLFTPKSPTSAGLNQICSVFVQG
jgi:hypothetical protein